MNTIDNQLHAFWLASYYLRLAHRAKKLKKFCGVFSFLIEPNQYFLLQQTLQAEAEQDKQELVIHHKNRRFFIVLLSEFAVVTLRTIK